ncbi:MULTISPECIES: 3-phosphoshikimate 1-carboxyvinyltransferase [Thermoactinomyces]|jgi:3-phosphoshikimate 1-carboxyvinyltransferase|uniref:3-phosphoshikimate 1-carboxyvinyltransferase n=1 Tax=Thermoactinomyces TaxID=2023 RepID=UPI0006735048|nr:MULTISPECIES: 3-phosphoshikimate 1-carboxyvinyltransferase [Thermoactinomyces]MBH8582321.1 3-phosphoshikimate 1-carboxyvinyltransferase [Thermoactinomyces sp. CICC 10735]QBK14241.1 3-phosphoshikimate 1-carboxyvinyltransferase [Thermoactinomyces vulgaris]QCV55623.1 3-phosphoshikimate 1-carboxyvinyltransferase [Thermoactinomyces vulgaris]
MMEISQSKPFQLTCKVPGDKSISHRSIMLGALAEGVTEVEGFLPGKDCLGTMQCFEQMGVEIERLSPTSVRIHGRGIHGLKEPVAPLDVGNSGTTIRLMLGILAGAPFFSTVIGDESIGRRPMDRVVQPLRKMGARIEGRENGRYTPLAIKGGRLQGITYHSPVASAQVKSCLLLAGLSAEGVTTVAEPSLSRDHTERMLPAFGAALTAKDHVVSIEGGQSLQGTKVRVPGDISSAAFLLAAALMVPGSQVTVEDVGLNPTRTGILDAFKQMGAGVEVEETGSWCNEPVGRVTVRTGELHGVTIGGEMIPRLIDEIPVLAVVATQAKGTTVIKDAKELKVKESNRIATTVNELKKLGANIEETEDGMVIEGPVTLRGGITTSHGDHRIGMSMAVAGLGSKETVKVLDVESIDVSFPGFFRYIQKMQVSQI